MFLRDDDDDGETALPAQCLHMSASAHPAFICTDSDAFVASQLAFAGVHLKNKHTNALHCTSFLESRVAIWVGALQAGLMALSVEVPSGMRDAGVRAVDRVEALLRRWACFAGGAILLYRVLLYEPLTTHCT